MKGFGTNPQKILLFPLNTRPKTHYTLAAFFFIGCSASIAFFGQDHDKTLRFVIAILSIVALVIHIFNKKAISKQ